MSVILSIQEKTEKTMGMLVTRRSSMPLLEDMDRLFERLWGSAPAEAQLSTTLPVDIVEADNALHFTFAVAGAKPEDISLTIEDGVLTVSGEWSHGWESDPSAKVYRREVRSGKFTRSLRLPETLDLDSVEASFENGLLAVKIARQEEVKVEPKRIPIKGSSVNKVIEAESPSN